MIKSECLLVLKKLDILPIKENMVFFILEFVRIAIQPMDLRSNTIKIKSFMEMLPMCFGNANPRFVNL